MNEVKRALSRYADFEGRASRREFWTFALVALGLVALSVWITVRLMSAQVVGQFGMLPMLVIVGGLVVPYYAAVARRLHDVGKSGWYMFVQLIPFIGGFILMLTLLQPGDAGENQYGPDPKVDPNAPTTF